ncbi:MAG: hypothetical protein HYZ69_02145 [Candidatus Colwellbacteria bacterium]|nr:hypothetical protein [Candidatus Colwellbacteria bacterium]
MSIESKISEQHEIENKEILLPEEIKHPTPLIMQEIDRIGGKGIIAYGEGWHNASGTLAYEVELVAELSKRGYKIERIFLEEQEDMQGKVREFYETGKMPEELIHYLEEGFVRQDAARKYQYKIALLESCKTLNIPVQFIDRNDAPDRDADWYNKIIRHIGYKPRGLYLLIAGNTHVSHSSKISRDIPVVAKLDRKYPNAVRSVLVETDGYIRDSNQVEASKCFLDDLEALGQSDELCAIKIERSPYQDVALARTGMRRDVKAAEAFDILVMVPGENLEKP